MLTFLFITIIILLIYGIEKSNKILFFDDFLSLEQTNSIKGILALTVMLHHYSQRIEYLNILDLSIKPFLYVGNLCVAVFFFYSGYGSMKGLERKKDYLNNFLKNKILRILIPFILINIIYIIISKIYYFTNFSYKEIFLYIFGFKLINSNAWYIWGIIYFYFSFYISFKYLKAKSGIVFLSLLTLIYVLINYSLGKGLWWYDSCSTFLFGIIYCKYNGFFIKLSKKYYSNLCYIFLLIFLITMFKINNISTVFIFDKLIYLCLKHLSALIFTFIIILFLMKFKIKNNLTTLLGRISFEFYLIHKLILDILRSNRIYLKSNYIYAIVAILLTCLVSITISFIINYLFKIIYLKRNLAKTL